MGCTAVGRTQHLSKEPYLPHAIVQNSSMARASVDPGQGLDAVQIDDPELMPERQPSVPETLLLLRQKVERLSKPIQALCDLADILEPPTQKPRAMAIMNKISGSLQTKQISRSGKPTLTHHVQAIFRAHKQTMLMTMLNAIANLNVLCNIFNRRKKNLDSRDWYSS